MKNIFKICAVMLLLVPLTGFHGGRAETYAKMADRSAARGDVDAAIQYLDRAVEADPKFTKGYMGRAFLHLKKGTRDLAIRDFTTAITLNPEVAEAYMGRGLVHADAGERALADADFKKACELGDASGCEFLKEGR